MRRERREPRAEPLPLAMAAVTVAGQCRERSPADLALFGPDAARFAARFVDTTVGEAMLAEAVRDGAAEREAELRTGSGAAAFRVSLWRQRGGDRIRLLAAFAHLPERPADECAGPAVAGARIESFADQLRFPLTAIAGMAEGLRRADGHAGQERPSELGNDMLAASWRMMRLLDDLLLLAELGAEAPPLRMSEVDVARLARRVLRLAQPVAAAAEVTLVQELGSGTGPSVLADETSLWSVIENLIRAAVGGSGPGGTVTVSCGEEAGELVLSVEARGDCRAGAGLSLGSTEAMSKANGARLQVAADDQFVARLAFPKERCLYPV